jgi:hypothetical protein
VACTFRQICRILLEKDTKESLEYMRACQPRRESPRLAAVADTAMGNMWSEIGEAVYPTYLSIIFVSYTNVLILSVYCHELWLSLLGMPEDVILDDFLHSNDYPQRPLSGTPY